MMIEGRGKRDKAILSTFLTGLFRDTCLNRNNEVNRKAALAIIAMMLFSNLLLIFILTPIPSVSAQSIDDRVEPVIVLGADLPDLNGTPINHIWVYAYVGGNWEQIPFQIDERNDVNGSYFFDAVDGVMDDNDEIVFMPFDAGEAAPATSWILGSENQRYKVKVTDPIDSSNKYVYIYNSSTLTKEFTDDYVDYDPISHVIYATDYTIGFNDTCLGIMDEMRISSSIFGDNTDMIDRFKYRIQITPVMIPIQIYEDHPSYDLTGYIDGPVRVIQQVETGYLTEEQASFINTIYAYKSYSLITRSMNLSISPDWMSVSLDFLNASIASINMTYYDSNSNEMTIDGIPDTPSSTDAPIWAEVTGANGTVITIENSSELGGTQSLYYNDNYAGAPVNESEPGQYGDNGIDISGPSAGNPTVYLSYYFLGPNQENVGSTYANFTDNPITTITLSQYGDPTPPPEIKDITKLPDPQEVKDYVNISAVVVDNLDQLDDAWVEIFYPNGSLLENITMIYDSDSNRYYHDRIYNNIGTYQFTIWTRDISDNWNSTSGQFVIQDTKSPTITDVVSFPDPQEVYDNVNISANISDNYQLYGAWVKVYDPFGGIVGNFSIIYDPIYSKYYWNQTFNIMGTYSYTIYANDSSNNSNSTSGQFVIQDSIPPVANAGSDQAVTEGTTVIFNGSGSIDNVTIENYTWTFTDNETLQTLFGISPTYAFHNIDDFEVVLKVTDTTGNWDTDTMFVNVSENITTGSISGIILDENGKPVTGATVTLVGTSYEATTNETGYYIIPNVTAGNYDLRVKKSGYDTKTITNITVTAGQDTVNGDFALKKASKKGAETYAWIILLIAIVIIFVIILMISHSRTKKEEEVSLEIELVEEKVEFECPDCGASVMPDMTNCPGCGVAFTEEGEVPETEIEEVEEKEGTGIPAAIAEIEEDEDIGIPVTEVELEEAEEAEEVEGETKVREISSARIEMEDLKKELLGDLKEPKDEETIIEPIELEEEEADKKEEQSEAKDILEMFKAELESPVSDDELKDEFDSLSKEIDEILGEGEEEKKKGEEDEDEEED